MAASARAAVAAIAPALPRLPVKRIICFSCRGADADLFGLLTSLDTDRPDCRQQRNWRETSLGQSTRPLNRPVQEAVLTCSRMTAECARPLEGRRGHCRLQLAGPGDRNGRSTRGMALRTRS